MWSIYKLILIILLIVYWNGEQVSCHKDSKGKDVKEKDVKGKDVKGKDAKGTDAKGTDAKGTDAKGTDAKGKDSKAKDAKGKDSIAKDSKVKDSGVAAGKDLVFSHIIFRHGDRNPAKGYPNDPFDDPKYWKDGLGQLTANGKQCLFELGKYLRKRYCNILKNQTYSPNLIRVQSSHMQRTFESGAAAMAGFFGHKQWNDTIQSIPIERISKEEDYFLYFTSAPCPRYTEEENILFNLPENKALFKKNKELFAYLQNHSGKPVQNFFQLYSIYDVLTIEKSRNLTLPEWTERVLPPGDLSKNMEEGAYLIFKWGTATKPLARLRCGFLIREMLERFTAKSQSKPSANYTFHVYSAHDGTIYSLLNCLKVVEMHPTPYGACILFEMYKPAKGDYYIQLFYKNTTAEVIHPLKIPDCGEKCTVEKFYTIYKDIIPTGDIKTECGIKTTK